MLRGWQAQSGQAFNRVSESGATSRITLTSSIKKAGEGEVWRTSHRGEVAKIYVLQNGIDQRAEKLAVMIANPPADPAAPNVSIAWPKALLNDHNGHPVGFMMPEVAKGKEPNYLYNQMLRRRQKLGIDWYYIHTAILNIAMVCQAVHERNYVIGDLKSENFLVSDRMQIVIIDTDSFQIQDPKTSKLFRCPVGTAEYTPPELMGKDFRSIERKPEHDHFAMAVLIYQFLTGAHPFSGGKFVGRGKPPEETVERIEKGWWLHGRHGHYKTIPSDLPYQVLHPRLQDLFRRCFDDGHRNPSARPSAREWVAAIQEAKAVLSWCTREEMHVYSGHNASCSWCDLSKSTKHDRWPNYGNYKSRSYTTAKESLRRTFHQGDLLRVLQTLDANPRMRSDSELRDIRKAIEDVQQEQVKVVQTPNVRVFISYSQECSTDLAVQLYHDLKTGGALPWLDRIDIQPGLSWPQEIEAAISSCDLFLLLLTPQAANSENVRDEVHWAFEKRKRIVTVMIETCPFDKIDFRLSRRQTLYFNAKPYEAAVEELASIMRELKQGQGGWS